MSLSESGNLNDADAGDYPDRPQSARSPSLLSPRHDLESGNGFDVRPDMPQLMGIRHLQSIPVASKADDRDGALPLYGMYSKITQERDNRHVGYLQQHMDGLLVFTGLFSATIAALLAVTIPDLKPNSQDTSAFYLGKIYQIFANPNGSIPSTLAKPPPFSPPRYVVWVNSLWLLALLINLSGALIMMLTKSLVVRYISVAQNGDYSPEMRARVHAALAKADPVGFRDSSLLPFCLHLSLFLFMAGLLIYTFNINHATFSALIWWIAITTLFYAIVTSLPFLDHTLLYTPFSPLVLRLYLVFAYAASQVCSWIKPLHRLSIRTGDQYRELSERYSEGFIEGQMKWLEEAASKPSSDIDAEVLERTLLALDEDDALESFFDAIPGFCDSKLLQKPLNSRVTTKLRCSLDGFLDRTFSSHLVTKSARNNRVIICLNAVYSALGPSAVSQILGNFFNGRTDEALESVEFGYSLIRWGHSSDNLIYPNVRRIVACIISRTQDRNDHWAILVKKVFGVPEEVIRAHLSHGDSMLLAILLHVAREALDTGRLEGGVLESLSQFGIHNTSLELQHDFCALWNEIVQEARNQGSGSTPTQILARIHHLFTTLHHGTGTNAVPDQLPASLDSIVPSRPSSYPLCNIPGHLPDSATQGLAIAPSTIPPPQFRNRRHSEPAIGVSVVQRPQLSSPKPGRTQSCCNFPTVPLPTRPSYPPKSSPSPPPLADSPDVITDDAMPDFADITLITGTADPIHGSTSGSGPTVQQVEETRTNPPSVVLGSLPTPLPTPALSHSAISAMLPSSLDPAAIQTHFLHHPLEASTLTTAPLSVSLQTTMDSNQDTSPGRAREQDDIQDSRPLTPRTDDDQPAPGDTTVL